jgi:hypothetical protein
LRAKVPVLIHDRSPAQVTKGFALIDKLLEKDVSKGRISSEEAKEARDRITVVGEQTGVAGLRDVDMVIEVSPFFSCAFIFDARPRDCVSMPGGFRISLLEANHLQKLRF